MLNELYEIQMTIVKALNSPFKRYLFEEIKWNTRMFAITGARGTGKTTLLLQYFKENYSSPEECLYISADNIRVVSFGLFNIADNFNKYGGNMLMIDEIHKYPNWAQELKNIYDSFPKLNIIISGSSTSAIVKGRSDLSRRVVVYDLKGLSFREFLSLETKTPLKKFKLEEILKDHGKIAAEITGTTRVLKHFKNYLTYGYYPFFLEDKDLYSGKLNNVIDKVLYEDIPTFFSIKTSSIPVLKKLIYLVATSQPFTPNVEKISSQLGVSREYIYHFIEYLERSGIFSLIFPNASGFKLVRKAQKIYLENPNLFFTLLEKEGLKAEEGAIREAFFINQLKPRHNILAGKEADFLVDNKYTFEIGGKNKDEHQIKGTSNAFIVSDGIETGSKNRIPLWLMGFLY